MTVPNTHCLGVLRYKAVDTYNIREREKCLTTCPHAVLWLLLLSSATWFIQPSFVRHATPQGRPHAGPNQLISTQHVHSRETWFTRKWGSSFHSIAWCITMEGLALSWVGVMKEGYYRAPKIPPIHQLIQWVLRTSVIWHLDYLDCFMLKAMYWYACGEGVVSIIGWCGNYQLNVLLLLHV